MRFKRVTEQRDLGVTIDSKMNFIAHKSSVISRAKSTLGFIKRFCYNVNNVGTLKTLYSALVESIVSHCSVVWLPDGSTWIDKIESVQKQFSMFALREYPNVTNNYKIHSYIDRLSKLNMDSLHKRRTETALVFFYNLINDLIHCPRLKDEIVMNDNSHNLRPHTIEMFKMKDTTLQHANSAPLHQMCKWANKLKEEFQQATSLNNFKTLIRPKIDELIKTEPNKLIKMNQLIFPDMVL
ncbi:MAG: hypothetical protein EOP33_08405 [Rickettsiaceae bacterium]|nr:MAG: hypothetical protein EOP33_08405 [Rickettsiaceae bacterium]